MPREIAGIIIAAIIGGTIVIGLLMQAIVSVVAKRRRAELPDDGIARIEDRLSRIEQAVEATAIEVERISEAQRFTTRLLSERTSERV